MNACKSFTITFLYILLYCLNITGSLTITGLTFPQHIMLGQPMVMECSFNKQPAQQIDSIKWYKDGHEFFRFHPDISPHNSQGRRKQFPTDGVTIDLNSTKFESNYGTGSHTLYLSNTKMSTSGDYRCQITESHPPFHTEQQDRNLTVIIQPENNSPRIKIDQDMVELGQEFEAECWSDRSKPAADLQFFVNGNRVSTESAGELEIFLERDGMETSYRTMKLLVRPHHLSQSILLVKCSATIGEAYWQTTEDQIQIVNIPSYLLDSGSSWLSDASVEMLLLNIFMSILMVLAH